jgi:hypothetical protein
MSWENWTDITIGDIIIKSKLDQIQDNLQYLTSFEIASGDNSGSNVGRCIGHYLTIFATDNATHCNTNNTTVGSNCGGTSYTGNYSTVNSAVGECGSGYLSNTKYNNWEGCKKNC